MSFTSLRSRLGFVGIFVALFAVIVTAFAVQRVTEQDIQSNLDRNIDNEIAIRDQIAFYGFENGDWDGIANEVRLLASGTGERIAVATLDGKILADSEQLIFDRTAPLPAQPLIIDPETTLVDFGFDPPFLDEVFLRTERETICYDAIEVPFTISVDAQNGLEAVEPLREMSATELIQFDKCVTEFGNLDGLIDLDFEPLSEEGIGPSADSIEPIQLFVGYGDGRDDTVLSSLRSWPFWSAIVALVALAGGLAVWLASRIGRPIASLTAAANQMSAGDLDARVDVTSADEIGALGQAFNAMATSLQAEDQARRTLTTDVAHELRSPLANLRGYLEGIQDGVVEADPTTISLLHEETTAMQALVDDLQQLSLAETGRLILALVETDIGDLVERVVEAHRATAVAEGVELSSFTTEGVRLSVDTNRFRQILANLVSNAIRHTGQHGTVAVELTGGETVAISVRDTGEGIEAQHLPHLFDRFYRADDSRTRATGGTGLGLAITQQLVHAHGGTIAVASEPGQGTVFTMRFPSQQD